MLITSKILSWMVSSIFRIEELASHVLLIAERMLLPTTGKNEEQVLDCSWKGQPGAWQCAWHTKLHIILGALFLMSLEHKYFQRFSFPKRKWKWLSLCISSIARSTWQSPRGPWQGCPPHLLPVSKATCSPPPSSPPPQGLWDQGCPDPPFPGSPPISQLCRSLSEIFSSRNAPRNGSASWAAGEHGRSLEHCGLMSVCPCRGSRSAGLSPRGPFGPVMMKITSYVRVRVCRSIFEI